jgi:hypothetical protein
MYHRIKHIYKLLKNNELDVYNSPFDRFATYAARLILCSKGLCDLAAPVGVTFGTMAGMDELRKLKGLEPIFLPFIADVLFPRSDQEAIYRDQRKLTANLFQNGAGNKFYEEELKIVKALEDNNYLDMNEANSWRSEVLKNKSLLEDNGTELQKQVMKNLRKLKEVQNNKS